MGEPLQAQSGPFRRSGAESSVARRPISFFEGSRRLSDQVKFPVKLLGDRTQPRSAGFEDGMSYVYLWRTQQEFLSDQQMEGTKNRVRDIKILFYTKTLASSSFTT
eukprot:COSAG02_NODE_115_length_35467_cov_292.837056_4_plen_106_part_00